MADRVYPVDRIRSPPTLLQPKKQGEVAVEIPRDVVYREAVPLPASHPGNKAARRRRSPCCCCLAWICSMLVALVLVLGIAVLIIYFVLQPRTPHYSVQDVQLSEFNVTTDSNGGIHLSSDVLFTIRARNPNKKIGIYYDDVKATLFYEGDQIGQGSINPFYQGHKNTTFVDMELKGIDAPLNQDVGSALKTALSDHSDITLKAHTVVRLRLKVGHWKTPRVKVRVTCTVDMSSPTLSGGARLKSNSCKVKL